MPTSDGQQDGIDLPSIFVMAPKDFARFTELPVQLQMQVWKKATENISADISDGTIKTHKESERCQSSWVMHLR